MSAESDRASLRTKTTIRVECYAGYRGEEKPRRFFLDERRVEVAEVVEAWLEPGVRCFKVKGDDGASYLLRQSEEDLEWRVIAHPRVGSTRPPGS